MNTAFFIFYIEPRPVWAIIVLTSLGSAGLNQRLICRTIPIYIKLGCCAGEFLQTHAAASSWYHCQ